MVVEKFAPGHDYRVLVVGGKVVAAARREPAQVLGDGVRTIRELVDVVESRSPPRRAPRHRAEQDQARRRVPWAFWPIKATRPIPFRRPARIVLIRRNGNLSTGGTAIDVTERVHPQVAARAVEAAQVIGLDIAGVDVVATDISVPLEEQGGVIVEINAAPGLRMHLQPSVGISRPVGEAIVATLFPDGEDGRIPIAAVTGTNGKTTTTRFIAHILRGKGLRVGMTCTDGIYVDSRRIDTGDCAGPQSARRGAHESGGRGRRLRNGPRRHPARRPGLRLAATWRW